MQPQPQSIQRPGREKNQDTVGQCHAPEPEDFQVEQEHQGAEERDRLIALVQEKQVVDEDQGHTKEGRGKSCGELVDAEQAIGPIHQPIEQDWFCDAQLTIERRRQAIPRFEHFPSCFGVPPLVTVGQPHVAEAQEEQQSRQCQEREEDQGVARAAGSGHRIVRVVRWNQMSLLSPGLS